MRLPHIIDYVYSDDDLLLDAKVRIAVLDEVLCDDRFEKKFRVRFIHHIGYKLFLGGQVDVKGYFYDKPNGDNGIQSIITPNMQILIPRKKECENTSKIILTKKNVYRIKSKDSFKEVILDENNRPKTINYIMEAYKNFDDSGKGQKGRFYIPGKDYELVVM